MDRSAPDVTGTRPGARRIARVLASGWTLFMLVLFWSPPPPQPRWTGAWIDEAVHATAFFGFAIAWSLTGLSTRWIAVLGVALAIATELVQPWLPWARSAELGDVLADSVGLGVGLCGLAWLRARRS